MCGSSLTHTHTQTHTRTSVAPVCVQREVQLSSWHTYTYTHAHTDSLSIYLTHTPIAPARVWGEVAEEFKAARLSRAHMCCSRLHTTNSPSRTSSKVHLRTNCPISSCFFLVCVHTRMYYFVRTRAQVKLAHELPNFSLFFFNLYIFIWIILCAAYTRERNALFLPVFFVCAFTYALFCAHTCARTGSLFPLSVSVWFKITSGRCH